MTDFPISRQCHLSEVLLSGEAATDKNNAITWEQVQAASRFARCCYDLIIDAFGRERVHTTSWFRSEEVNEQIKGSSKTSDHLKGCAVDFYVDGVNPQEVVDWIVKHVDFDQVKAYEDGHVHVGQRDKANRKQVLK